MRPTKAEIDRLRNERDDALARLRIAERNIEILTIKLKVIAEGVR